MLEGIFGSARRCRAVARAARQRLALPAYRPAGITDPGYSIYRRPRAFFPFACFFPRDFEAFTGPRKTRSGRSLIADRLNFRAARRAPSLPPYPVSLNKRVTVSPPRRKWTWNPCVCFLARGFVSMRRMFCSESGLALFFMGPLRVGHSKLAWRNCKRTLS